MWHPEKQKTSVVPTGLKICWTQIVWLSIKKYIMLKYRKKCVMKNQINPFLVIFCV